MADQSKLLKEYNESKQELINDLRIIQITLLDEFKKTVREIQRDFRKMRLEILRDFAPARKRNKSIDKNPGVRKDSDSGCK